jgi:uncharacterized protein
MDFDWDSAKAKLNRRKHGVSFEEAEDVLAAAAIFEDVGHSQTETRYLAIGFSTKGRMLTVVFTRLGVGSYRIITARTATKQEQNRYAKANFENH